MPIKQRLRLVIAVGNEAIFVMFFVVFPFPFLYLFQKAAGGHGKLE